MYYLTPMYLFLTLHITASFYFTLPCTIQLPPPCSLRPMTTHSITMSFNPFDAAAGFLRQPQVAIAQHETQHQPTPIAVRFTLNALSHQQLFPTLIQQHHSLARKLTQAMCPARLPPLWIKGGWGQWGQCHQQWQYMSSATADRSHPPRGGNDEGEIASPNPTRRTVAAQLVSQQLLWRRGKRKVGQDLKQNQKAKRRELTPTRRNPPMQWCRVKQSPPTRQKRPLNWIWSKYLKLSNDCSFQSLRASNESTPSWWMTRQRWDSVRNCESIEVDISSW